MAKKILLGGLLLFTSSTSIFAENLNSVPTIEQAQQIVQIQRDMTNNPIPRTRYWLVIPESSQAKLLVDAILAKYALFQPVAVISNEQLLLILDGSQSPSVLKNEIPQAKKVGLYPKIVEYDPDAYKVYVPPSKACPVNNFSVADLIKKAVARIENFYPNSPKKKAIVKLLVKTLNLMGENYSPPISAPSATSAPSHSVQSVPKAESLW